MSEPEPLLSVRGLTKHFPVTRGLFGRVVGQVRAVDDLSFDIAPGETLGLVGESGSGKTTAGRSILRLVEPTSGRVLFDGADVTAADPRTLRALRPRMQIVFQDPYASLNPRHRVIDIVGEALEVHGIARGADVEKRVASVLRKVGLSPSWINRYPHEFSGGQRQRLGIARAIALEPKLIVCDEPVSALDVSIQAQVVNLLKDLARDLELSYLFIAHDLAIVRHISHRIAVMYLGQLVEVAPANRLFQAPAHPYTRALLSAIPVPDPRRKRTRLVLTGDVPSPMNPPLGCRFHTRCPAAFERCSTEEPRTVDVEPGHAVKCFHAYDAEGDDWYRIVSERIATAERARPAAPAPVEVFAPFEPRDTESTPPPAESEVPRRPPGAFALTPRRMSAFVALFVAGVVLSVLSFPPKASDAEKKLRAIATELDEHRLVTGSYPNELADLGFRLPSLERSGSLVDPWGRPFVYRTTEAGQRYELRSLSADGVPSADDIVRAGHFDPASQALGASRRAR
ncbi:MAG TPA: oligopeptide/dipeptide ABC transporter ATP-binding protein [Polyangiaceae bacterium]